MNRTPIEAHNYAERDRLVKQLARIMRTIDPPELPAIDSPRLKQLLN